jgi:acyl-CoA thioesterase-1
MEVVMPVRSSTKVAAVLLGFATFDRAAATEPISIVALGASGIHGKGVALSEAFPAQLENMLRADGFNVQVINAGVDGDTTTGMLFRMDSVIPPTTKVAIVQPGTNDFRSRKHGLSVEQHLANVEAIVGRLRARQIRVVLCGDDPSLGAIARHYDSVSLSCSDPSHLLDGEHLDPIGHRIVAGRLRPMIEGMLNGR